MVYRGLITLIIATLALLVSFIFLYGQPFQSEPATDDKKTEHSVIDEPATHDQSAEQVIDPAKLSEMVNKREEYSGADELFFKTLPLSLRGTPRPTALGVDEDEELIADHRVKNLFEYYLTAIGEEPLDRIITRIQHDLSEQLDGIALAQANDLLEGYLQYRNNMAVIKNQFVNTYGSQTYDLDVVKEMKRVLRESRFGFLPEEAVTGFFEQEDQYDDYMMAKVSISANSALSASQKDLQLTQLDQSSPRWIIESSQRANLVSNVRAEEKALRAEGASEEEIYALRERSYGAEGAENLRALDQQRAQWRALVASYRVDLNNMIASAGGASNLDEASLNSLRSQYFDGPQLTRIRAIDKVELGL
ncbi:lipase secretion chaperone [Alkalimarinus coralli]|nr:lipase secretion chaperone [Alkalimarinus coralli]